MTKKKRGLSTWETIRALPGFILVVALSLVIFAQIQRRVGHSDGPGLLPVYFVCALLPAFVLVYGVAGAIQAKLARGDALVTITPVRAVVLGTFAILGCIAFAAWPRPQPARTTPEPGAQPTPPSTDPETRARAIAREAVVKRLSELGVKDLQLDAHQITRDGKPYWRVTTRGVVDDYVIDVGEGTRTDLYGRPEPNVDVFLAGAAPLGDVEAPDTAPVTTQ